MNCNPAPKEIVEDREEMALTIYAHLRSSKAGEQPGMLLNQGSLVSFLLDLVLFVMFFFSFAFDTSGVVLHRFVSLAM